MENMFWQEICIKYNQLMSVCVLSQVTSCGTRMVQTDMEGFESLQKRRPIESKQTETYQTTFPLYE